MVKTIQESEFNDIIASGTSVIDFFATWCGPCKMLSPVIEELSDDLAGKVSFYRIDIDENPTLTSSLGINSVPSVFLFQDGKKKSESIGFRPKAQMRAWIDENL